MPKKCKNDTILHRKENKWWELFCPSSWMGIQYFNCGGDAAIHYSKILDAHSLWHHRRWAKAKKSHLLFYPLNAYLDNEFHCRNQIARLQNGGPYKMNKSIKVAKFESLVCLHVCVGEGRWASMSVGVWVHPVFILFVNSNTIHKYTHPLV